MKCFKKMVVGIVLLVGGNFLSNAVYAQDGEVEVTEEQIIAYAQLMDTIEVMKLAIVDTIESMVKSNEAIEATRYNELNDQVKTVEDVETLEEASEEEKAFLVEVIKTKDAMVESIKTVNRDKAIAMGEGGRVYKRVKEAIASDDEAKATFEAEKSKLEAMRTPEPEEESVE